MNASSVLKMLKQNYSICYHDNRLIIAGVMFMTQTPLHTYNNLSTAQCTTMVHCSERILLVLWQVLPFQWHQCMMALIFIRCLPGLNQKWASGITGFTPMNLKVHIISFIKLLLFNITSYLNNFNLHYLCNKNKGFVMHLKQLQKCHFKCPQTSGHNSNLFLPPPFNQAEWRGCFSG